jgi:hypothetical protein
MFKLATLFGILLALAGVSIVLKQVFHVDLALARVAFGLLLVWGGLAMLARGIGVSVPSPIAHGDDAIVFSSGLLDIGRQREIDVIFSSGTVDLTTIDPAAPSPALDINTIFGSTTVLYDASIPLRVQATSAFGLTELPNHEAFAFGDRAWQSQDYALASRSLSVKVASVFGSTRFVARGTEPAALSTTSPAL